MDRKVCRAPPRSRERLVFLAKRSSTPGEIAPPPTLGPKTASVLRYGTWGGTHEKQCKLLLKLYLKLYKGNTNTHRKAPKPHQRSALISMLKNKESSTCTSFCLYQHGEWCVHTGARAPIPIRTYESKETNHSEHQISRNDVANFLAKLMASSTLSSESLNCLKRGTSAQ